MAQLVTSHFRKGVTQKSLMPARFGGTVLNRATVSYALGKLVSPTGNGTLIFAP